MKPRRATAKNEWLAKLTRSPRLQLWILSFLLGNLILTCSVAQTPVVSAEKSSSAVFKNLKVFSDIPSDQLIPSMQFMAASLGVQCDFCHVERAFDRDDKEPKRIARRMIHMTRALNANDFGGKQLVSCYSCHRGHSKPESVPAIPDIATPYVSATQPEANPIDLPPASDIVQRYAAAVGGSERISHLKTISEKGTIESGSVKFPLEISKAAPGRITTLIHYPAGDSVSTFDGTTGWSLSHDRPLRPMNAAEVDENSLNASIPFTSDLRSLFSGLQTVKRNKVNNEPVVLLRGERPNLPPVELYFDENSGLIVRIVRYARSPLGLLPNQIDFSDYRDVEGVKLPFHWVSATPLGRFTIQIATVTVDVPVSEDLFSKPALGSQSSTQER